MEERVHIVECKCGGRGLLYVDSDNNMRRPYYIKCACGRRSKSFAHIDTAIADWNELNKPIKAKVRYHCGFCGAEVFLGIDQCGKCGAEIEW